MKNNRQLETDVVEERSRLYTTTEDPVCTFCGENTITRNAPHSDEEDNRQSAGIVGVITRNLGALCEHPHYGTNGSKKFVHRTSID